MAAAKPPSLLVPGLLRVTIPVSRNHPLKAATELLLQTSDFANLGRSSGPALRGEIQMSLLRVLATSIVLCVFSAFQLQAQKATCTNWNIWSLNPANPSNPAPFAADVNDNRTV